MMKKNLMFLALAAIGLASCNGGFKKGNGGMLYDIHVDKGAPRIKEGDFISLQLIAKTDGDSVLMSTYEQGRPILTLLKKAEPAKIKKYIDDSKLTGATTASGLYYLITKPGTGDKPAVGDTVAVNYVGKFVNGKLFETNIKEVAQKEKTFNPMMQYKPIHIPVGVKAVIPGW